MDRETRERQMLEELHAESDRGCILVAASALDIFLEELLMASFVAEPHAVKLAISPLFKPMQPLSSFSVKIKLAYSLGLIAKNDFNDLERIREIRNIAAHEHSALTFESEVVIEIARKFDGPILGMSLQEKFDKKSPALSQQKLIYVIELEGPPEPPLPAGELARRVRVLFILTVARISLDITSKTKDLESGAREWHDTK
jgi:DNA-binding MltR family transcriptional regulator